MDSRINWRLVVTTSCFASSLIGVRIVPAAVRICMHRRAFAQRLTFGAWIAGAWAVPFAIAFGAGAWIIIRCEPVAARLAAFVGIPPESRNGNKETYIGTANEIEKKRRQAQKNGRGRTSGRDGFRARRSFRIVQAAGTPFWCTRRQP